MIPAELLGCKTAVVPENWPSFANLRLLFGGISAGAPRVVTCCHSVPVTL